MPQKKYSSLSGDQLVLYPGKLGVQVNKTPVNVLGPKLSLTQVTFGGLSVSSGPRVPSP